VHLDITPRLDQPPPPGGGREWAAFDKQHNMVADNKPSDNEVRFDQR
jgi:hypothetical protein